MDVDPAMDAPAPIVSVVMPVYNTAAYVGQTIEALLAQTFRDFELLILDDGSTDHTPQILARYADRDERIRVISRPNKGIVASRNELIAACRGKYMAANDADDLSVPERLEKQVAYMEAHPECVLLGSRVVVMDPYGSPTYVTEHKLTHPEIEKELLGNGGGWAVVQSSMICRTEAARTIGGYRGEHPVFSEDHDLYLRMAEQGEVANLPEPLTWYRRHYSSTTRTYYLEKIKRHAETREKVLREAHERRGLPFPADWRFSPITAPPRDEQARLWGWAALKHGNVAVARRHARSALRHGPFNVASWKLLLAAFRQTTDTTGQTFPSAYRLASASVPHRSPTT